MRALMFILAFFAGTVLAMATENDLAQAEANPSKAETLMLTGSKNESTRLLKLAPKLTALNEVIITGIKSEETAANLVSSVAACTHVRTITFRNCELNQLPSNLRMLTQVKSFRSENSVVKDGEQFYNAIADMPNVENVNVLGSDFRSLPRSFARLRVMKNINLVNEDLQLARGFDLNTKSPDELIARDSVQFGFGDDALNLRYTCYNDDACRSHVQMFRDVLQGAYRQSNVFYSPIQARAFVKKHPLVKPPVAGVDVYPDVYSYSAMTGTTVEYGSGTKISIPANAFEDANGSPVTGNVEITYREFRDPVDIVLSGIPMTYDSGGVAGNFESAGMFEINASQNGTEVYLKEGQNVGIDFAVVDTASTFNFYRLDEKNGWQYLESPGAVEQEKIEVAPKAEAPMSAAVQYYVSNILSAAPAPLTKDTTSFDNRYSDTAYIANVKYENRKDDFYFKRKREASCKLYLRKHGSGADYTLVRIAGVKGYHKDRELNVYDRYYWKIDGKMSGSQLKQEYGRKTGINDVRVINESGQYYLELKYSWGFKKIAAEPVKMDDHHKAKSISDVMKNQLFRQYSGRLDNRRKSMDRENQRVVKSYQRKLNRSSRDSVLVFDRSKKFMDDSEATMEFNPWNTYVADERERTKTAMQRAWEATGNVYQALSVAGMGIYNCDQIRRLVNPVSKVTSAVKTASAAVVPLIIYVIDKARNMVFSYSGTPVKISYSRNATNTLLMVDGTGSLYMTDPEQFKTGIQSENGETFEGTMISGPQTSPQTVREAVFGPSPE